MPDSEIVQIPLIIEQIQYHLITTRDYASFGKLDTNVQILANEDS